MKRIIFISAIILIIASAGTVKGQSDNKETRDVKGFTKVSFGVSGNLYINFGPEFKVVLEGDKKYLDEIITEVSGNRLVIKKENWKFHFDEKVDVYVTMPEIEGLGVSGSGKAEIKDAVKSNDLNLSVSGSGKLYANQVSVSNLDCSISGSGDIILGNGTTSKTGISISGSGNFEGESITFNNDLALCVLSRRHLAGYKSFPDKFVKPHFGIRSVNFGIIKVCWTDCFVRFLGSFGFGFILSRERVFISKLADNNRFSGC